MPSSDINRRVSSLVELGSGGRIVNAAGLGVYVMVAVKGKKRMGVVVCVFARRG